MKRRSYRVRPAGRRRGGGAHIGRRCWEDRRDDTHAQARKELRETYGVDAGPGASRGDHSGSHCAIGLDRCEAVRVIRDHFDALEQTLAPAAERAADWFGGGSGTVRDALAQGRAGATISGPTGVIDGDTLKVRGTRGAPARHRRP